MDKLLIICIIIFSNCALYSQNCDSVLNIAVKAFVNGDTLLALKEIQRTILFDTTSNNSQKYVTAAQLFAYVGNYDKAEVFINQAYQKVNSNLQQNEILMAKADIYISSKKYFNAIGTLMQIDTEEFEELSAGQNLRLAICCYHLGKYSQCQEYISKVVKPEKQHELEKLIRKTRRLGKPSPATAGISSAIIPGSGQYIANSPIDGIASEMLIGSFVTLGIYLAKNYGNWTAVLCVLPWIQRYYIGGIKNATECAKRNRATKSYKLLNKILGSSVLQYQNEFKRSQFGS
ncbi:MAG: hypothetical protein IKQ70_04970 [Bacteroidales bacterium]|nr:hypothetical protein [Bacteroidales bacterium]